MINQLILAWQNTANRMWVPIGRLQEKTVNLNTTYRFEYVKGVAPFVQNNMFKPLGAMGQVDIIYESEKLFPLFKNRLLPKSRPEYSDYLNWLNMHKEDTPIKELAITNGLKVTDSFQLYAIPQKENLTYQLSFFCHGIRYLPKEAQERILTLNVDEELLLMKDCQNPYDASAMCLRTHEPAYLIGFCPRLYAKDFEKLLSMNAAVKVSVVKVNRDAPAQFRLLCQLSAEWKAEFHPFDETEFEPMNSSHCTQVFSS